MTEEYKSPNRWELKKTDDVHRLYVKYRPVTKPLPQDVAEAVSNMFCAQHEFVKAKWDFNKAVRNADAALKPYMRRRVIMTLEEPYMKLIAREEVPQK